MKKYIKNHAKVGVGLGVLLGSFLVAYAAMRLFYSQSVTSDLTKKMVFEFELDSKIHAAEIGPGDALYVEPIIKNTATEAMYVFIEIDTPEYDGQSLYELESNELWSLVESSSESMVYAYGDGNLTKLMPGESTDSLTSQICMRDVTNAQFSEIDDINITITGYGIDTTGENTDMASVWNECKTLR